MVDDEQRNLPPDVTASPWETCALEDGEAEVGTYRVQYRVMRRDLPTALGGPDLPGFVGRLPDKTRFMVSEDVAPEDRPYCVVHEHIEFNELEGRPGSCAAALEKELALVPEEQRPIYIERRRAFFQRLVDYYKASKDEAFKAEIAASLAYLETL